jgi:hypothetical protein
MTVLEMMKKDLSSVVGLNIEYDFGGSFPIIGEIGEARINSYKTVLDNEEFVGVYYSIAFADKPLSFYGVYKNNIKVLDTLSQ